MEVAVDIGGMAIVIADTAGLHETEDLVEQIGIQRAHQKYSVRFICGENDDVDVYSE